MNMQSATLKAGLAALALAASPAWANYAQCLLESLPGTQNAPAFGAAMQMCGQKYPDRLFDIKRGEGRGLLGYKTANACTVDKGKATSWQPAAYQIKAACDCLYGESRGDWDMCQRYEIPPGVREQHTNSKTVKEQIALEHHYRRIYTAHPDADALFDRKDFQAWWVKDPAKAKIMSSGSTQQIIKLMSDFKMLPSSEIDELLKNAPAYTSPPGFKPFTGKLDDEWWKKGATPVN